jgi:release factor glutamine methyltransferase
VALDISEQALAVAARNAARHRVADRLSLYCSDCFSVLDSSLNQFEMIVSNPPYVPEDAIAGLQREVREHEPLSALTPGGDGLAMIRRLIAESPDFLVASGHLLFEIGFGQHEVVAQMINQNIWELVGIRPDLAGIPRTTLLRKK